jgi:hypothetical protein
MDVIWYIIGREKMVHTGKYDTYLQNRGWFIQIANRVYVQYARKKREVRWNF